VSGVTLGEIFPHAEGFGPWRSALVQGLATDSRRVHPGDLFFGLPGTRTTGADFAADALRRGASALVLPRGSTPPEGASGIVHPSPYRALAEAAVRFYGDPGRGMRLAGVTGTNGKTTTALLVAHLLRADGRRCAYWTTTLVELPGAAFRPQWTTPPAHELQRFLRAARDRGEDTSVLEVSSHAVRQERILGLRFDVGVATSFAPDHLDFHPTVEDYYDAKRSFIRGLPQEGAAVLCRDDPKVLAMGQGARARVLTFGEDPGADVRIEGLAQAEGRIEGRLSAQGDGLGAKGSWAFRLGLPGRHNARNAAAAFAAALWLGVPPEGAARALGTFAGPPRRLEREEIGPFSVYNDVAMNEASFRAVLETLRDLQPGQAVVVCALRGNRGAAVNARIAGILARWERELGYAPLIVTESVSELRTYAVDYQVRPEEVAAFRAAAAEGSLELSWHLELAPAIEEAVARLRPGGVLLLLGTFGMDRGPAMARSLLRRRIGLPPAPGEDYLEPEESGY